MRPWLALGLALVLAPAAAAQTQSDLSWHSVRGDDGYKAGLHSPAFGPNFVLLWLQCEPRGVALRIQFEKPGRRGARHPVTVDLDGRRFALTGEVYHDDMDDDTSWSRIALARGDPLIAALAAGGNALKISGRGENLDVPTRGMAGAMGAFRAGCP